MRKHIIISILSAFILIPSCRREIVQEEIDKSIIVTSQSSYPDVKSAISGSIEEGFEIRWNINDALGVYSSFGTANSEHKIIELKKEGKAIFSGKVKKYERELKLYAYSPYNPDAGSNPNEVSLHHPSQQVMVGDSFDHSASFLVSSPITTLLTNTSEQYPEIGRWRFSLIGTYIRVSVKDITNKNIFEDADVRKMKIEAPGKKLSGDFILNLTNGKVKFSDEASDFVEISIPKGVKLKDISAWAVLNPFTLNNEPLKLTIETEKQTIVKTAKLNRDFKAGNLYTMGVEIDETCNTYYLFFAEDYCEYSKFYWQGGVENQKTFNVESNIEWDVEISEPDEASATKLDSQTFVICLPRSKWPAPKIYTVTIRPIGESSVTPKTITATLMSASYINGGDGNIDTHNDGSITISSNGGNVFMKTFEQFKYGNYVWTFSDSSINSGDFMLNNWSDNGIYMMLKYGFGNNAEISGSLSAGGIINVGGQDVCFGFDDGWSNKWNETWVFPHGLYPTEFNKLKSIRVLISPDTRSGTLQNNIISRKVWINGILVVNNTANSGDIWAGGSSQPGFNYMYGFKSAEGSIRIEKFEIDPNWWNYPEPQINGKDVIFREEFNTDGEVNPEYWSIIGPGTSSWQTNMSGMPEHSFVSNGNLVLTLKRDNDGVVRSGAIKTEYKAAFGNQCHIEARIKFENDCNNAGQAFWLMPDSRFQTYKGWPNGGEIDIMEHSYLNTYIQQTLHSKYIHEVSPGNTEGKVSYHGYNPGEYNIYGVDIYTDKIKFYVNGELTMTYDNMKLSNETTQMQWPFGTNPYYIIFSISPVGDKNINSPSYSLIDWVRITKI